MKTWFQFKPSPFELTVVAALALIGWAAYELNELGPGASERSKGLTDLRDEYIALADSVQTNLATLETIRTNAPGSKDLHKEADHFDAVGQDWSRWMEQERRLWVSVSAQSPETNAVANGYSEVSEAQLARDDLLPLMATIRKADSNYVQAGYYLILNTGQPLITDKLQSNEQLLMRSRSWLMTLSRRARLSATAVDVAITGAKGEYAAMKDYFRSMRLGLLVAVAGLMFFLINVIHRRTMSKTRALLELRDAELRRNLANSAQFVREGQEPAHEIRQPLTDMNTRSFITPVESAEILRVSTNRHGYSPDEKPGGHIDRYKFLEPIGEGGCGVVYVAEQTEPVRRRVAIKVIKLGMDTRQVIARFEAERQALALMDHPNIAKVLDAGADKSGRPYFVMELVKGIPVTRYCDENKLDIHQRLDLFIQICHAIQHAHQKGIIHRDIKPSNILVSDHDGTPVPKIIDFGIAKATTDQRLTDKTLYTAIEQFIGTPAYMSPEQAKLSGLDVDARSDIYSLGVLLYELLTGWTPFDSKRLIEAGLDEIRRIIREEDPPRPSTRLSTLDGAEKSAAAARRHSEPPRLLNLIQGDLDWIVMKAIEKDRNRRYETAKGLAAEIQRFQRNEPVEARPPSRIYRVGRFIQRNRLAMRFTLAGGTTLVLLAASFIWYARLTSSRLTDAGSSTFWKIHGIQLALVSYEIDCGHYPSADLGLAALLEPHGEPNWNGPYISAPESDASTILLDQWGTPLRYTLENGSPRITSAGPDRAFGTKDDVSANQPHARTSSTNSSPASNQTDVSH